ncbi:MAG: electron transport complex subunit RsxE [Pseudomonadales bacterium]|nr:electron transport complex subunit RsxE [Pseudomonadales bacterium]
MSARREQAVAPPVGAAAGVAAGGAAATLRAGVLARNPAWTQLLGLCPLLAVTTSVVNSVALALSSAMVLIGANLAVSCLRRWIPDFARLPAYVLIIATFTTCAVLLLEAYAFDLYLRIALFVQIIVTNCMILARAEAFASRQPPGLALLDALGTAAGFALALLVLGALREALGHGTLFAGMELLFGPAAAGWRIDLPGLDAGLLLVSLPPGAFIVAGLLLGAGHAIRTRLRR